MGHEKRTSIATGAVSPRAKRLIIRSGKPILDDLSLSISVGEHTAILGPNGCGKSTLIKLLTRQYYPLVRADDRPTVTILGEDRWNVADLRTKLGIVSTDLHQRFLETGEITGFEAALSGFFASQGLAPHHVVTDTMRDHAHEALVRMGAAHLATREIGTLSTGEGRRILIARALVTKPLALVLDEPTTGLDIVASRKFMDTVRTLAQEGTTVVLVTHHVDEIIPEIEHVILLRTGRVFQDGAKADILTSENLSHLYNAPVTVTKVGDFYSASC